MKSPNARILNFVALFLVPATVFCSNMEWLDADRDGLDDVIRWTPRGGAQLHLNQGDGTFESSGRRFGDDMGNLNDAVVLDDDRVALVTENGTQIWDVSHSGPFRSGGLPGARRAERRDFDRDGRGDLVLDDTLWRQDEAGHFTRVAFDELGLDAEPAVAPQPSDALAGGGDENVSVSGNVGINNPRPRTELDIARNADGDAISRVWISNDWPSDESAPSELVFDRRELISTQLAAVGVDHTNRDFYVWVNGADRLNITEAGSVGIGTAIPRAELDVTGAIAVGGDLVIDAGGQWVGSPAGLLGPSGPPGPSGPSGPAGSTEFTPEQSQILMELANALSLELVSDGEGGTIATLRLTGVNLQLVNGLGATNGNPTVPESIDSAEVETNGSGNLIIGYNELRGGLDEDDRTGSHNLIVGAYNDCSGLGGIVAGSHNAATAPYSSVTSGYANTASGTCSSVSGGVQGEASGYYSSVSGGGLNQASGTYASVSGGWSNGASGAYSSVSGGNDNQATGYYSSVSGGVFNESMGSYSSVSGGIFNEAMGTDSSVSGGYENDASGAYSSVSGGYNNDASGDYSSVSGGRSNTASGLKSSVSGGHNNDASGAYSSVSGGYDNEALGDQSSVSAGRSNVASGDYSSVSGGDSNRPSGPFSSVSGGYGNAAAGASASVSGGNGNAATGWYSNVSGGWHRSTTGHYDWVGGSLYENE